MENKFLDDGKGIVRTDSIEVYGAREHNLKNLDIIIPKNKLVVITGISGSGKSSLAFDTIYAEGQRRYMETFGAYARQFIGELERPDVDKISGLSPVISIEQKTTNKNPRSTVGTVTELYDFLRLLFARASEAYSFNTGKKMVKWSEEEIVNNIFKKFDGFKITLLAPLVRGRKGHYRELFEEIRKKGYLKVRVDGEIKDITPKMQVDRYKIHDIELVIDRLKVTSDLRTRVSQSVQQALKFGKDLMFIEAHPYLPEGKATTTQDKQPIPNSSEKDTAPAAQSKLFENVNKYQSSGSVHQVTPTSGEPEGAVYSRQLMCEDTGISYEEPSPNSFSFNSPYGACPGCKGLGQVYSVNMDAIIPDDSKTINQGGIAPLGGEREAYIFRQVQNLSRKYKFSLDKPIRDMEPGALNFILYGKENGIAKEDLQYNDDVEADIYSGEFEGVVNQVKRWFATTSSEAIQRWAEGFMELTECNQCNGTRLKKESLWFKIDEKNIAELSSLNLVKLMNWFNELEERLNDRQKIIAHEILKEIKERLQFLLDVGLTYLSLNRPSRTLSGGESQRIRLATQIGSQLQGITYILDEPSIGLHQRDNHRLITALQ
nr:excinuclease ABC subunit UvrA [Segetibacter sp.]